ncbi:MAG: hypothetical protein RML38_09130, partial [Bacteroidia bacterium]|nr:hypothetical protein [Bacteroidia bacterium]
KGTPKKINLILYSPSRNKNRHVSCVYLVYFYRNFYKSLLYVANNKSIAYERNNHQQNRCHWRCSFDFTSMRNT